MTPVIPGVRRPETSKLAGFFQNAGVGGCFFLRGSRRLKWVLESFLEFFFWPRPAAPAAGSADFAGSPKKILVVKPDGIGDLILAVPFLRGLKKSYPESSVTVVAHPSAAPLLETCPYVEEVLPFANRWRTFFRFRGMGKASGFARKYLAGREFDLAVFPRWDVDYYYGGLLIRGSGAPRRIGYSNRVSFKKRGLNPGYDRCYTLTASGGRGLHEVSRNLELLEKLGAKPEGEGLEFWPGPEDERAADAVLSAAGIEGGKTMVALGVGATREVKKWPLERYGELADWLRECYGVEVLLLGADSDRAAGETLLSLARPGLRPLAGLLSLNQAGVVLSRCKVFIGNDSGTKHLAAAAGCPVVEISWFPKGGDPELDSPERFSAWGPANRVLRPSSASLFCKNKCEALFAHCILQVGLEEVKRAVSEMIKAS